MKSISFEKMRRERSAARHRAGGEGHAAEESAGPRHVQEAQGLCRPRASPCGAAAQDAGRLTAIRRTRKDIWQSGIYGTGRRKSSTARVFSGPGNGNITVNARPLDEYFGRETARMIVRQPLEAANAADHFDVTVTVRGGGNTGQAGAIRHGITRALIELRRNLAQPAAQGRLRHPRRPRGRAQEGWSAQGPQAPAVLQALIAPRAARPWVRAAIPATLMRE